MMICGQTAIKQGILSKKKKIALLCIKGILGNYWSKFENIDHLVFLIGLARLTSDNDG